MIGYLFGSIAWSAVWGVAGAIFTLLVQHIATHWRIS